MNAPTLIVGLGGTGSDVAMRVSQMVTEEQRKQIGFAVFDTDVNELRVIKEKDKKVHTIQTSTKLSVGEYLDIDKHARDEWFPVNAILNSKTLTEGAGQVRAVSRMAFETAIRAGKMEELHKAIEELYKLEGNEYQQALRVIIVSSLAGGTGSGLILPVALYIKNYLQTHFRQSANITRGFFLLPEVFYGVIPGQAERNNLKSNAYATLRELDAFMMKGDSTLPAKYHDTVKMDFPCVGSGKFESYDVRPFDFCFLFDAQNADGSKLNSFTQYLDHAANCIYAQSIGPMNKRSNSSEDNTIRKLCAEKGRNRYAGAGTSMLIYPVDTVKKYLSLSWAMESVSDQWSVFDNMFKKRFAENAKARKQGVRVAEIREDSFYVDTIEQMARNHDAFAVAIVDACARFDETGFNKISDNWDTYVYELKRKIEIDSAGNNRTIDGYKNDASVAINNLNGEKNNDREEAWADFVYAYKQLCMYKTAVSRNIEDTASTVAYSIFKADDDSVTSNQLGYKIETYMRNGKGDFIHPNAVRYLLYKSAESLGFELALVQKNIKDEEEYFATFEERYFDDKSTDDYVETVDDLAKRKIPLADRIRKRMSGEQEDLKAAYNQYMQKINNYRVDRVLEAVYKEGIEYIKKLSVSFSSFYRSFDSKIASMSRELKHIENRFVRMKGTAAKYVCASPECLAKMLEKMPYTGSSIDIDSKLAEKIYLKVREFALMEAIPENSNFFSSVFDNEILEYFSDTLMTSYGAEIDLDIISAIEREAIYEHGIYDQADLDIYVKRVFDETKILAAPFIEKPLGEERDPINACAFNKSLRTDDESPRTRLVNEELMNFGGQPDDDVPKNMILFYKSFYGLRANDLSKFAPPQKAETYNRTGGEYFNAYYDLVSKIHPVPSNSKVITPHIDRWWHNVAMMPDLDDANQERQEEEILAAFFWGIVGGYVGYYQERTKSYYSLRNPKELKLDVDSAELVVSNGTVCDRFYEVLDAMSIYPELVTKILERNDRMIENEINRDKTLEDSELMRKILKDLKVTEYKLDDDNKKPRSIFDLPMLLKRSMTTDAYDEEKITRLLEVEIKEMKKFFYKYCEEKEYVARVSDFLMSQFELFLANVEEESVAMRTIKKEHVFSVFCSIIAEAFEELELPEEAEKVHAKTKMIIE